MKTATNKVLKEGLESNIPEQEIVRLLSELQKKDSLIEKLKNELLYLRRSLFGRSSERFLNENPDQLKLAFEGLEVLPEEVAEAEKQEISYERTKKKNPARPVRQALPAELERKEEIIEPDPIPEDAKCIGEEITEVLEYQPGKLYVRRIVRKKYAFSGDAGVVIGDLPSLPLPKSNAGSSLLAHLLVSKYQDHLPFYRQIEIYNRLGVSLAPATVNGWFSAAVDLLEPLYDTLRKQILSSDYIQIDETSIGVVDKDRPGAVRKGYHWIVRAPEPLMNVIARQREYLSLMRAPYAI